MPANTDLVKVPHTTDIFDAIQLSEFAFCLHDPKYFIKNFCYIQHPLKGRMKFELYQFQEELIDIYHTYRYNISMLPRQMGKSMAAAAYLLWYAMFNADSTVLIAAHVYRGAQEIMSRIRFMYENCPNHIRAGVTAYNRGSIEFDNGSRILAQATTENTGRGLAISVVYLDEFSFVPSRIASEFWTSLSPTLSTGGKCLITSTPNQDDDQFAQIWKQASNTIDEFGNDKEVGKNGFKAFKVHWSEHPDRDEEWARIERGKIGEARFKREHECEFVAYDETLIDQLFLHGWEVGEQPYAKLGETRLYSPLKDNKIYVVALDPSLGTGSDPAAIQVFSLPDMVQVAEWQHNKTPIPKQITILRDICKYIEENTKNSEIYWSVENNTLGEAALVTIQEMGEENIPGQFLSEPRKPQLNKKHRKGFTTTHNSKLAACAKLKQWIENRKIHIKSKNLVREIKTFVATGTTYKAKSGETDDLVMATILVVRMIQVISKYDESTFEKVKESFDDDRHIPMPIGIL